LHTKKHGASQPASQPASQAASQEAASQTWPRRPAASQAACREAVPAALVNQKLHTDIANLRHALIDFVKNACLKTATKTLPFFGKPPRSPGDERTAKRTSNTHVARKRQRFVAEKRQRFCCRFSASIFSKISKAVFGFANMVAEKRQQKRCRFSARPVQGSLRLRSSSHPRRSPSAPTVRP
jgi:hypothetical protein